MPLFRRRRARPIHEQLAQGHGLLEWEPVYQPVRSFSGTLDVLHGARPREWDAVVSVETELPGAEGRFVVLPDGTLLIEDGADGEYGPLAEAVERELRPPYRAFARRSGDRLWAVAAKRLEVVELPEEVDGDEIQVVAREGERVAHVDGVPTFARVTELQRVGERAGDDYVVRARRLDGLLWEVETQPL